MVSERALPFLHALCWSRIVSELVGPGAQRCVLLPRRATACEVLLGERACVGSDALGLALLEHLPESGSYYLPHEDVGLEKAAELHERDMVLDVSVTTADGTGVSTTLTANLDCIPGTGS